MKEVKAPNFEMAKDDHTKKNRMFVRAIQGEYNLTQELARLRSLPRVRKAKDLPFRGYPQQFHRDYLIPKDGLGQTLHIHLEEYAPGGVSQKHGHVNEAVFYILDGEGAEEHDGIRYDWEAGDVAIVHNNCVHQHFNRSPHKPARALVMKTKPMYMFMNMLFQKTIIGAQKEPSATGAGFVPRDDEWYDQAHLAHEHEDLAHVHDDHDHDHVVFTTAHEHDHDRQ